MRSKKKKTKKKNAKNPTAPRPHHEIHSSLATATISRRRATKHVPRVCPYSPASIHPEFVDIGLVQLSQSVKNTNVTHTQIDRQTDRPIEIMAPCTHPGTCREVNEARRPYTCSRPCAFEEKKTKTKTRNPAAPKTHHEIHSSPATATTSRRRAKKHVPRVRP